MRSLRTDWPPAVGLTVPNGKCSKGCSSVRCTSDKADLLRSSVPKPRVSTTKLA